MKLKDIASVQMGYSFRTRLEVTASGGVAVIQMKDLLGNIVSCDHLVRIEFEDLKEHHCVMKDDLIFRSRGLITTAAILLENPGRAVVAAPLLRIRVTNSGEVLPEYLNWYIGQKKAQQYFASMSMGSVQKMISKQAIEELELSLPSPEKQKCIVELARLAQKEQKLGYMLLDKQKRYVETMLMQFAKGTTN